MGIEAANTGVLFVVLKMLPPFFNRQKLQCAHGVNNIIMTIHFIIEHIGMQSMNGQPFRTAVLFDFLYTGQRNFQCVNNKAASGKINGIPSLSTANVQQAGALPVPNCYKHKADEVYLHLCIVL